MALKLRKDIKKSSYYVWFLGAKESKGLRGSDYISPVIKHLEEREKDVEPFKVTLQVSHKGLKIIQNVVSQGAKNSKPKNETIKHFIPHNTITYCHQQEDIIACILLLFNPVTKCPLHVHAYRCDSLETATLLKGQLQILIDRPENQKKIDEIENRLQPRKETKKLESSIGSDTGASTRESEDSEERFALENSRIATLYDSVAAELRAKLNKKNSPILLPPRDYDTVHRQKGNLTGIELRRCLNTNIVGQNVKNRRLESSGGSSGIGSDHPPSPESPETPDASRFHTLETHHSTSEDDDWNQGTPVDSTLYLTGSHPVTLPRPVRNSSSDHIERNEKSPERTQQLHRFSRYAHDDLKFTKSLDNTDNYRKSTKTSNNLTKYLEKPIAKFSSNKYLERTKSIEKEKKDDTLFQSRYLSKSREVLSGNEKDFESYDENRERKIIRNQERIPEKSYKPDNIRDREFLKRELNRELHEKYFREEKDREKRYVQEKNEERDKKYFEDDGFIDDSTRYRHRSTDLEPKSPARKFLYDDDDAVFVDNKPHIDYPVPKTRQKFVQNAKISDKDRKYYDKSFEINSYSRPRSPDQLDDRERYYNGSSNGYDRERNIDAIGSNDMKRDRDVTTSNKKERYRDAVANYEREKERTGIETRNLRSKIKPNDPRYYECNEKNRSPSKNSSRNDKNFDRDFTRTPSREERSHDRYFDDSDNTIHRKNPLFRQRTPSPEEIRAPEDRFKDAKEKFLLMEKDRLEEERSRPEAPISPTIQHNEKPFLGFLKRNQSMVAYGSKENNLRKGHDERYFNRRDREDSRDFEDERPRPAPRQVSEEVRYREKDVPSDRYRNTDRFDPKRRSMFSLLEDERKKNSNDIAKELKRRSYLDVGNHFDNFDGDSRERNRRPLNLSPEPERYNSPESQHSKSAYNLEKMTAEIQDLPRFDPKFAKNPQKIIKNAPAGYRHSFAEPKIRDKHFGNKKQFSENFLHRANSSVSNLHPRLGLASVHPY